MLNQKRLLMKPEVRQLIVLWVSVLFSNMLIGDWYFFPNFTRDIRGIESSVNQEQISQGKNSASVQELHSLKELSKAEKEMFYWHQATFPHQDFVNMMPGKNVFGWYAHFFAVPKYLQRMDLLIDLGLIDDADETFLNGSLIGRTGAVPGGSAWQSDRLYRASAGISTNDQNSLLIHVWSLWGLGGIVRHPVIKSAICSENTQWNLAFIKDVDAPKGGINSAENLSQALNICFMKNSPTWHQVSMPWKGYTDWKDDIHWAVFRLDFNLRRADGTLCTFSSPVVLDLGCVFDVAAVFLNGERIGLLGRFGEETEKPFTEAASQARILVEPRHWSRTGNNQLYIVIFRERGVGGLPGVPGIALENPLEQDYMREEYLFREAFDIYVNSNRLKEAEILLSQASKVSGLSSEWILSSQAHLAFLRWFDSNQLDSVQLERLLSGISSLIHACPTSIPRQSGAQAFCRILRCAEQDPQLNAAVRRYFPEFKQRICSLPQDWQTKGNWIPYRGHDAYVLAAMGQLGDWKGGFTPLDYRRAIPGNVDKPRHWLEPSARYVADPCALLMPSAYRQEMGDSSHFLTNVPTAVGDYLSGKKTRRASWWDDHGEMHPFDDSGPNLDVEVKIANDCGNIVAAYMMDYDWRKTSHPRQQSLFIYENSCFVDAQWFGKIDTGCYAILGMEGIGKLTLRFAKHRGACVAVNGLFVDSIDRSLPCLPRRFYPTATTSNNNQFAGDYLSDQLNGDIDDELFAWYEHIRTSTGLQRLNYAKQYLNYQRALLSSQAGQVGRFVFAVAADLCGECNNAIPAWTSSLPNQFEELKTLSYLLESLSEEASVQHGAWYLAAVRKFLQMLPSSNELSPQESDEIIGNLGLSCLVPAALPAMQACSFELQRRGVPNNSGNAQTLELFIQQSIGKRTMRQRIGEWSFPVKRP